MRPDRSWQFEWRRAWPEVWAPPFESRWASLYSSAPARDVFQHPDLVRAWADTCGRAAGIDPVIGIGSGPDGAQVVLPWVVQAREGRLVTRRYLGYAGDDLFGYHNPLATTIDLNWNAAWTQARAETASDCDVALFRSIDRRLSPADAMPAADEHTVLQLDRRAGFEDLLNHCSANHRGDVRRRRRRLAERGAVSLWIPSGDEGPAALADWQHEGAAAYQDVWTRRARRNTAWRGALDAMIARVLTDGVARGWGHYAVLRVDGQSIAWHIGLVDRERLFWWIPAHRPDWEAFAPGKVLLAAIIEHLCNAGWRALHFLAGAHPYKLAWRPDHAEIAALRWYAPGVRGRVLSWYDRRARSA